MTYVIPASTESGISWIVKTTHLPTRESFMLHDMHFIAIVDNINEETARAVVEQSTKVKDLLAREIQGSPDTYRCCKKCGALAVFSMTIAGNTKEHVTTKDSRPWSCSECENQSDFDDIKSSHEHMILLKRFSQKNQKDIIA